MASPPRSRGAFLPGVVAAVVAVGLGLCAANLPVLLFSPAPKAANRIPRVRLGADGPQVWQKGLDKAFLDVDASPAERFEGLKEFLSSPLEVAASLREAVQVVADKGLSDGQPDALDALFPQGTLARADLEGLLAVARQAPEVMADLRGSRVTTGLGTPSLDQVKEAATKLLSAQGVAEVADTSRNALRSTPAGLEEPSFEVVHVGRGYEVRQYGRCSVARQRLPPAAPGEISTPEPFNTLVNFLLGDRENATEANMTMAMPVELQYNDNDPDEQVMSFYLPPNSTMLTDPGMAVLEAPARLVAVRRFPGIATAGEVSREYQKLLNTLAVDGAYEPAQDGPYSVLQYNPPYTVPWRRRNEVVVTVVATPEQATRDADDE